MEDDKGKQHLANLKYKEDVIGLPQPFNNALHKAKGLTRDRLNERGQDILTLYQATIMLKRVIPKHS